MEGNFEIKIRVRIDVATCWRDSEVICEFSFIPLVVRFYIAEVRHLDVLGQTRALHNIAESCELIHQLQLDTVCDTMHCHEFAWVIDAINLKQKIVFEWR